MRVAIGLDLDNTLVGYDELLCDLAVSEGYLPPGPAGAPLGLGKRELRDILRAQHDGEQRWRKLQALIYGRHMPRARLMPGVRAFLEACAELRAAGVRFRLYIVSHKTRTANNYSDGTDFHAAAKRFLEDQGFFAPGVGLEPSQVFFEPTRADKVARIAALGCTHFVDDLEEVFAEPSFPKDVTRILYDPAGCAKALPGVLRVATWQDISGLLLAALRPGGEPDVPDYSALAGEAVAACLPIYGGRNSKVFQVLTASGKRYAGKHYHRHANDPRDRLGTEWMSLSLLAEKGISGVALPQARDVSRGVALYTFLEGPQASLAPATASDMTACLEFLDALRHLSRGLTAAEAAAIPAASEACFSLAALEENLRSRLSRLLAVPTQACLGRELAAFLASDLTPFLEASLLLARDLFDDPTEELPPGRRLLSPSDFGLHNAIRSPNGLRFVDFEYFGWDDPAKTLCDFLLHPAMNLPKPLRNLFANGFMTRFGGSDGDQSFDRRVRALYPLYSVKWCMILLNEFLREADARRRFALGSSCVADDRERRLAQLTKARAVLDQARYSHATDDMR